MDGPRSFTLQNTEIEFLGAAGEVTGSKTVMRAHGKSILIDCGLFQGEKSSREKNWLKPGDHLSRIDAVVITHAHLDHCGYLPRLVKDGYRGPVYCSPGTLALMRIILKDSAHLQEEDAEFANRTGYSNHKPAEPLYTLRDAEQALTQVKILPMGVWQTVVPGVEVQLTRAGHIIGSSVARFRVKGKPEDSLITFSGDVGHGRQQTIQGPDPLPETDWLILESTYGGRKHSPDSPLDHLERILKSVIRRDGVLVIPSFAVGRAQEVLYLIRMLEDRKLITPVPVVLDSPMAEEATGVYLAHPEDHPPGLDFEKKSKNFFPHRFEWVRNARESIALNDRKGPFVLLSASGMLQGGRILHHLKVLLPDSRNAVLFVGYQAEGTKGWFLEHQGKVEGAIRIHHVPVPVNAQIDSIDSLSAHGDTDDLVAWVKSGRMLPKKIILNHGTPESARALALRIETELKIKAVPVR